LKKSSQKICKIQKVIVILPRKVKTALRMNKKSLIIFALTMLLGAGQAAIAQDVVQKAPIETEQQQAVVIIVNESTIHIKNAEKQVLEIYNLAGVKVSTIKIDSTDKTIELSSLPKGCYILKVGKTARKCYLK
jgi:hypothetical protein